MQEQVCRDQKMIGNEVLYAINHEEQKTLMHRSIGGVEIEDDEGLIYHGTAFLLSSDLLLTAAHNVYSRKSKKPYRRLKFYLSTKGVGDHHYEVEAFKFLDEYRNATNSDSYKYDYAVLKLKSGVGYQQYMPLLHPCKQCLMANNKKVDLDIYGLAGTKDNWKLLDRQGKRFVLKQYGLSGRDRIKEVDTQRCTISYKMSTLPGDSGTAVCINNQIIAVHVAAKGQGIQMNFGRMVAADLLRNVARWREEVNGKPFGIVKQECQHNPPNNPHLPNTAQMAVNAVSPNLSKQQQSIYQISKFRPSLHPKIKELCLVSNELTSIDLSRSNHLLKLNLARNKLTKIDLSQSIQLKELSLDQNQLSQINLTHNSQLQVIKLSNNQLKQVDLRNCPKVTDLSLADNSIETVKFWPHPLNNFSLKNQKKKCIAILLHAPGQEEKTISWGNRNIKVYNRKMDMNIHNCQYQFKLECVNQ